MMRKVIIALAVVTGLTGYAIAQAPPFPQTLPANSVVGRLGINPGPAQAIPFATLSSLLSISKNVQVVTGSGTTTILQSTQILIFNKTIASASPATLPTVVGRNQIELEIYDWTGLAGDITLTPAGAERIMGATTAWIVGSGGVAQSGGSIKLLPLETLTGWLVR